MRLKQSQLRKIIREEAQRLSELYAGSSLGSYMEQCVAKLWEADSFVQKALAEAEHNEEHEFLTNIHKMLEKFAYTMHDKAQHISGGHVKPQQKKRAPVPQAPKSVR